MTNALDLSVRWDSMRPGAAFFSTGLDDATHTVRVVGSGIWHEPDAARYFDEQRRVIDEARRRYGAVKAFFDVRDWVVECEQSALQFQHMNLEMYRPEDRLVAVVKSSVDKKHPRTALAIGMREAFISLNAAETWLQAYSG